MVELRDKLAAMEVLEDARKRVTATGAVGDVVSALLNLGYEQRTAEQAVERAVERTGNDGSAETFEALLRDALQQLTGPTQTGARAVR